MVGSVLEDDWNVFEGSWKFVGICLEDVWEIVGRYFGIILKHFSGIFGRFLGYLLGDFFFHYFQVL